MESKKTLQLVAGPTIIPADVRALYAAEYGSSDIEEEFYQEYGVLCDRLQRLLLTKNDVVVMMGEGMVCLWAGLKSVLRPGDKVLAVSNGLYGEGIGQMAAGLGADVTFVRSPWEHSIDPKQVSDEIKKVGPKLVTMCHCETPQGLLNDIEGIGSAAHDVGALVYVDFVSSGGGAPVKVDEWGIDLGLLGSQKVLSCAPDLGVMTVSDRAWKVIVDLRSHEVGRHLIRDIFHKENKWMLANHEDVKYAGYDALLPFKTALRDKYFPYTYSWGSVAALSWAVEQLLEEGLDAVHDRHRQCQAYVRQAAEEIGLKLYTTTAGSPTVTALLVPETIKWEQFDRECRREGLVFAGSYGELAGKVFRVGHMGSQAHPQYMQAAMDRLRAVLNRMANGQ